MEKKFVQYLIDIGFIDKKSFIQILSQYNSIDIHNNNKFNQKMTEILLAFFDQISDLQKKYICFHLPAKFIKIINQKKLSKLKSIIVKNELKNKFLILKCLFKWYRFFHKNKNNNFKVNNCNNNSMNNNQLFRYNSFNAIKSDKSKQYINEGNNKIYNYMKEFINNTNNINPKDICKRTKNIN